MPAGSCPYPGCGKLGIYACTKCDRVLYCCTDHKRDDWESHRDECGVAVPVTRVDDDAATTSGGGRGKSAHRHNNAAIHPIRSKPKATTTSEPEAESKLGRIKSSACNDAMVVLGDASPRPDADGGGQPKERWAAVSPQRRAGGGANTGGDAQANGGGQQQQRQQPSRTRPPQQQRRRCKKLVCCDRGNDEKVSRKIFNVMDAEGTNKIGWEEFYDFVKGSYERYASLVGSFTQHSTEPVPRFRRMVLAQVMGDSDNKEKDIFGDKMEDDVLEVLFDHSRNFAGKGYARKTRELFRRFDVNDSGNISFDEFCEALHEMAFFKYNTVVHGRKMLLVERSLFCFRLDNKLRWAAIQAAYSPVFDAILVTIIVVNTLLIAMEDPSDPNLAQGNPAMYTPLNQVVHSSDYVFTTLYFVEFAIKAVASGFAVGYGVYLSNWWNVFDFSILVLSVLIIVVELSLEDSAAEQEVSEFVKVLRVFRIMRPLKSITAVPQMRRLASTLIAAIIALKEIFFLLWLLWVIFGIILVDLLHDRLNRRCHEQTEDEMLHDLVLDDGRNASAVARNASLDPRIRPPSVDLSQVWNTTDLERACGFHGNAAHHCYAYDAASGNATHAPELCLGAGDLELVTLALPPAAADTFVWRNDTFIYNNRMNFGITHFDNLGFAIISIFQISTLEGWVDIMYIAQDAYHDMVIFWVFLFIMLLCGVMMIGLILAVIEEVHNTESERLSDAKVDDWSTSANLISLKGLRSVIYSLYFGGLGRWLRRARTVIKRRSQHRSKILSSTELATLHLSLIHI